MAEPENSRFKETLKGLNVIYLALLFGQLMMGALFVILINFYPQEAGMEAETSYIINTSALLISIAAIPGGYFLFSQKGKQAQESTNEELKIEHFRIATILQLTTFELAGIANLLAFFLTRSQQSLFIFAIVVIIFLMNKPGEQKYLDNFE